MNTNNDNKRYGIKPNYTIRNSYKYFDDTTFMDKHQREVYERTAQLMRQHGLTTVIDVGCGSGYKLINYLGEFETIGFDVSPTVEYLTKTYPDRRWEHSDFNKPDGFSADLIICSDVIEHLLEPDELLNFIKRVPSQYIVLSTPSRNHVYRFWERGFRNGPPRNPCHIRE